MTQHFMHLQSVYFNLIKFGIKTVELRAWDVDLYALYYITK